MIKRYWLAGHEWIEDTETGQAVHWPEGEEPPVEADELIQRLQDQHVGKLELNN